MTIGAFTVPNTPWDLNWKDLTAAFEVNKDFGLDLERLVREGQAAHGRMQDGAQDQAQDQDS